MSCAFCSEAKAPHACGICKASLCKECLQYIDTNHFSFMSRVPAKLKLANYCLSCFEKEVLPEQAKYDELMERAKEVYFLTKAYPGYIRVLKRHTKRVDVKLCEDRRETILRLAFFAAELNFNAIIEGDVDSSKVRREGGYQLSTWSGSAMPAEIDAVQLERSSLKRI